jgi:hypothetical protein
MIINSIKFHYAIFQNPVNRKVDFPGHVASRNICPEFQNQNNMKSNSKLSFFSVRFALTTIAIAIGQMFSHAQTDELPKLAVWKIESNNYTATSEDLAKSIRIEAHKMGLHRVLDDAAVQRAADLSKVKLSKCTDATCICAIGARAEADLIITGSVEYFQGVLLVTLNLYDVKKQALINSSLSEFDELQVHEMVMMHLALSKLFKVEPLPHAAMKLRNSNPKTKFDVYQGPPRLALSGPRMGAVYMTGATAEMIQAKQSEGGYDAYPVLFQFGYQFEKQYLNEGNFQALVEVIPNITGLDQGVFIPGLAVLHGLRSNKSGWEFAFGPTITGVRRAHGFYDESGAWHLKGAWNPEWGDNPHAIELRADSRGEFGVNTGFLIGAGKSFKSGRVNIPVNAYVVPSKQGTRAGVSFGFNSKRLR